MLDVIAFLLVLVVLVLAGSVVVFQFITGVPPMPSAASEIADLVALLKQAGVAERGIVYELGCGWGSVVLALAKAFPHAQIRGIELSPVPYWVARFRTRNLSNVHLQRRNFYDCDLRDADAVTSYLTIKPTSRLATFLDRVLRPGTPVVSVTFWFRARQVAAVREGKGLRGKVALYFWPAQLNQRDHH
jgi:cyclopropane fatty-acyl-phospholipid synthase-like methyltransferase